MLAGCPTGSGEVIVVDDSGDEGIENSGQTAPLSGGPGKVGGVKAHLTEGCVLAPTAINVDGGLGGSVANQKKFCSTPDVMDLEVQEDEEVTLLSNSPALLRDKRERERGRGCDGDTHEERQRGREGGT